MRLLQKYSYCLLIAALVWPLLPAHAEPSTKLSERARQKQIAEETRADLRKKLNELKENILKTEKAHTHAADALAASEAAISNANRSLRELSTEQAKTQAQLSALSKNQQELEASIAKQRARLSKILRNQYQNGQQDHLKLMLSGENPNQIGRELRYLGYVSLAQSKVITELDNNLRAVEENKSKAEEARAALEEIAQEQREQKALLEKEKNNRKGLVTKLSSKLQNQRKEAGNLAKDEERLASLVDRLANLITQQRKAEEAAALAKKRTKQSKEVTASRERSTEKSVEKPAAKNTEKEASNNVKNKPSSNVDSEEDSAPEYSAHNDFAKLRGKLRMPVKGELVASFGSKRNDGPSWKGLFIKAGEGTDVKAAADGVVIFADWMRGFGNLLIIDHGSQYMTIYGNNQSLLKRPGDKVKIGEVVAAAGNSGGNEHSGLYFEMRHQGRAIDPLVWINR
jgi:septal ring factor EnvC (AmiA/AmiB activator)